MQIYSWLWVKAKEETSFTSFTRFAFTNNSQTFSSLLPFGEGNEGKIQELHVDMRAYARGKMIGKWEFYLRAKYNLLGDRKNYLLGN